ncbi:hypothetical protein BH23ACT6_BH23ACT6_05220 [soil metagenome]
MDSCDLNRPEVAPATHEVALLGRGELVVTDEKENEVLQQLLEEDSNVSVILETTDQTYTFSCTVGSETTTATLRSVTGSTYEL